MEKQTLIKLIDEPQNISENDLENLEEIIASYPYCQVAHLLIAKYAQDHGSVYAPQKIRRAATYAYDRSRFRQLILQKGASGQEEQIHLKTHFEQIDTNTPGFTSAMDDLEEAYEQDLVQKNTPQEDPTNTSFFDKVELGNESEHPAESLENESADPDSNNNNGEASLTEFPADWLNENKAMDLFQGGEETQAIQIYEALIAKEPQKTAYFYRQLAILTDDDEYSQKAIEFENQKFESDQLDQDPYFENIENDSSDGPSPSEEESKSPNTSFFDGIEGLEDAEVQSSNESAHAEEESSISPSSEAQETPKTKEEEELDSSETSFFDQVESENSSKSEESGPDIKLDTLFEEQEVDPNQVQEEPEAFFEALNQIEDFHQVERTSLGEDEPLLALERSQEGEASEPESMDPEKDEPNLRQENTQKEDSENESFFERFEEDAESSPSIDTEVNDKAQDSNVSETQAIYLDNQGDTQGAIEIYEKLLEANPQKASYYLSQINVLKGDINTEEESATNPTPSSQDSDSPAQVEEDLNEQLAINLFNEGHLEEAVDIYKKLILRFPEKESYYLRQIEILKS